MKKFGLDYLLFISLISLLFVRMTDLNQRRKQRHDAIPARLKYTIKKKGEGDFAIQSHEMR